MFNLNLRTGPGDSANVLFKTSTALISLAALTLLYIYYKKPYILLELYTWYEYIFEISIFYGESLLSYQISSSLIICLLVAMYYLYYNSYLVMFNILNFNLIILYVLLLYYCIPGFASDGLDGVSVLLLWTASEFDMLF